MFTYGAHLVLLVRIVPNTPGSSLTSPAAVGTVDPMGFVVAVTGSSGFIGRRVVAHARLRGWETLGLDLLPAPTASAPDRFVAADVRDFDLLRRHLGNVDMVVHAAASVPLAHSKEMHEINVLGTKNVSLAAPESFVVHMSSSAVYGRPRSLPVSSSTPPSPCEPYGRSKLKAEQVFCASRPDGRWSILRPRTVVDSSRGGLFSTLADLVAAGLPVPVFGSSTTIQVLHVDDLARAALDAYATPAAHSAVINLGAPNPLPLVDHLRTAISKTASSSKILVLPARPAMFAAELAVRTHLVPFALWHAKTYGVSNVVDLAEVPPTLLPKMSNSDTLSSIFSASGAHLDNSSPHLSSLSSPLLSVLLRLSRRWAA